MMIICMDVVQANIVTTLISFYNRIFLFPGDMYRGDDSEFEPAWVSNERDQFREFRDKDGDGYLDEEEVR